MLLTLYRIRCDALTVSGVNSLQSLDAARDVQTGAAHLADLFRTNPMGQYVGSFPLHPVAGSLGIEQ